MLRLVIISAMLAACLGAPQSSILDGRVIGGGPAEIENFPYQLSLEHFGTPDCGAIIISEDFAITAAHCIHNDSPGNIVVRAGSVDNTRGGSIHNVQDILEHEEYVTYTDGYDIAILKVNPPFKFGEKVQPISLASSTSVPGSSSVVSGWGSVSYPYPSYPSLLQQVEVLIVDRVKCGQDYKTERITDTMLCAAVPEGGKDACAGDSGGPLVARGELVGVVSWGKGCAFKEYPGVYADVAVFRSWIKKHTGI